MPSLKFCEEPKAKFDQLLFHKLVKSLTVPKSLAFRSALEWIRAYQANALQNNPFYIQQKKKKVFQHKKQTNLWKQGFAYLDKQQQKQRKQQYSK